MHPLNTALVQKVKNKDMIITDRPSKEVRLLTYNTYLLPTAFENRKGQGYLHERREEIMKAMKDFDIICF